MFENIFDEFLKDMENYFDGNDDMHSSSYDLKYLFSLQKKRLVDKNIKVKYDFTCDKSDFTSSSYSNVLKDDLDVKFDEYSKSCLLDYSISHNDKVLVNEKDTICVKQNIIDAKKDGNIFDREFTCPGCGSVDTVENLIYKGCSFCRSKFQKKDLFPKVMGYYYFPFMAYNKKSLIAPVLIWTLILSVIGFIPALYFKIFDLGTSIFAVPLIAFAISEIVAVIKMTFKGVKNTKGISLKDYFSNTKLQALNVDETKLDYYQFDYKSVTLLKLLLFSNFDNDVPFYEGSNLKEQFNDLIDTKYRGLSKVLDVNVDDKYIYITTEIYLKNYYFINNSVVIKNENLKVIYYKNKDVYNDFNYSMKRVKCPHCGGTFDAYKSKKCTFCRKDVNLAEMDWIIKSIEIVK